MSQCRSTENCGLHTSITNTGEWYDSTTQQREKTTDTYAVGTCESTVGVAKIVVSAHFIANDLTLELPGGSIEGGSEASGSHKYSWAS